MKRAFTVLSLLLTLSLLSCQPEKIELLELSAHQVELSNVEKSVTVSITATSPWSAAVASSWCTISPKSGSGDGIITITANSNVGEEVRDATIEISSKELRKFIKISQAPLTLSLQPSQLSFEKEGGTFELELVSNGEWELIAPQEGWIEVEPLRGVESATITVTVLPNEEAARSLTLSFKYGVSTKELVVTQGKGVASPLDAPTLKAPAEGKSGVSKLTTFRWSSAISDEESEVDLIYNLKIGESVGNWSRDIEVSDTLYHSTEELEANRLYYWQVTATDRFDNSNVSSQAGTFTTGNLTSYKDGEYLLYQNNTKGNRPSTLIFMGDGYMAEEFIEGGRFDVDMDEGIEAFFAVEPYKSLREYFSVYKIASYSKESGVTQTDRGVNRETKFKSKFKGGSSLEADNNIVFTEAKKIDGVNDESLKDQLIILVLNEDRYAGTCWMWLDGKAIAIVPVSRSFTGSNGHYTNLIAHEAGGHGYPKLGDEYVTSEGSGETIPQSEIDDFKTYENGGFYPNISLTSSSELVKWRHFFNQDNYDDVGTYEGGYYYSKGVWRPESISCMVDNRLYFNAPSREAIVKRIYSIAGVPYSFTAFKQLEESYLNTLQLPVAGATRGVDRTFIPLARPVIVKE